MPESISLTWEQMLKKHPSLRSYAGTEGNFEHNIAIATAAYNLGYNKALLEKQLESMLIEED